MKRFLLFASVFVVAIASVTPTAYGDWWECPFTDRFTSLRRALRGSGSRLECTAVDVPLFWDRPSSQSISIFVTRVTSTPPGSLEQATRQFWFVAGGPGGANEENAERFIADFPAVFGRDIDLVFADHRGTGYSEPLYCDDPYGVSGSCGKELVGKWGASGLHQFSTTAAARDLDHLMVTLGGGGAVKEIHLYGLSYGSFLVQRFLLNFTAKLTTVTIDGICPMDISLADWDTNLNSVGRDLMDRCGADAFCSANFASGDPFGALDRFFKQIRTNASATCLGRLGMESRVSDVAAAFGSWLPDAPTRILIPPVLFRFIRCNDDDVDVLDHVFNRGKVAVHDDEPLAYSDALYLNIGMSELFGRNGPPPMEELERIIRESYFTGGDTTPSARRVYDVWPRYKHDSLYGKYAAEQAKKTPLLILNGDLDAITPLYWAQTVAKKYAGTKAQLVVVPDAPHVSLFWSYTSEDSKMTCALSILASFINSPQHIPDTSCLKNILRNDWKGERESTKEVARWVLGTDNMWGR